MKAVREKQQLTYKGKFIRITAYFSIEMLGARRGWNNVFQELKKK
jgi:hypothetical protein